MKKGEYLEQIIESLDYSKFINKLYESEHTKAFSNLVIWRIHYNHDEGLALLQTMITRKKAYKQIKRMLEDKECDISTSLIESDCEQTTEKTDNKSSLMNDLFGETIDDLKLLPFSIKKETSEIILTILQELDIISILNNENYAKIVYNLLDVAFVPVTRA